MKNPKQMAFLMLIIILSCSNFIFGQAPTISTHPQGNGSLLGTSATFTVVASGTGVLTYQWKKDNVNISGAISTSYTIASTTLPDNGAKFKCSVSNAGGTTVSDEATLYVLQTDERASANLQVLYNFEDGSGETISDVSSVGTAIDLTIDDNTLVGWTDKGLNIHGNSRIKSANIATKIIDACKNSNEITFEAWLLPSNVTTRDLNTRILTIGNSTSSSERNFGIVQKKANHYYLLRTTGTDLNGVPTTEFDTMFVALTHLVFTRSTEGTVKTYRNGQLVLTDERIGSFSNWDDSHHIYLGNETSSFYYWEGTYYLTALYNRALTEFEVQHNYTFGVESDEVPSFVTHPKDKFVLENETVNLSSFAISIFPVSYQWKKNGVDISGETNSTLSLLTTNVDDGAIITCVATSSAGSKESSSATLTVSSGSDRVDAGQQVLYTFREGSGNKVNDVSDNGSPLNFTIFSTDAVEWVSDGLKINSTPSIITTAPATKIITASKSSNEVTIEAWLKSENITQTGPARIVSLSSNENSRDFSLSQEADSFEVRLRSTTTSNNGSALLTPKGTVTVPGFDHVVSTRDENGNVKIYVNGTLKKSGLIDGSLSNWEPSFLSLGNEIGGTDLHWKGTISLVAVFDRALSAGEVARNYVYGPVGIIKAPTDLALTSNLPFKVSIGWKDNSIKESGYIIERSVASPIDYSVLDTIAADNISYVDSIFTNNKAYVYRVKAFNSNGESPYSNVLNVHTRTLPISTPTGLAYTLHATFGVPVLTWDDNSDNELGFIVERRGTTIGSLYKGVDTVATNIITYTDGTVTDSTVFDYRIYAFNKDTISTFSNELRAEILTDIEADESIPEEYSLAQNFPNPFNPSTKINFGLPEKSDVSLRIFNLLGQSVLTILNEEYSAGNHTVNFDASNFTSGVYIYTITAKGVDGNSFRESKKMILMK